MITRNWRAWAATLPLLALLGIVACGGDGCGEDPNAKKTTTQSSGGGGGGKPGGGSGDVNLADWDGSGRGGAASAPQQPAPQQPQAPTPPPQVRMAPLDEIGKGDWEPRVLKSTGTVFVLVTGRTCPDCDLVSPVLRRLAVNYPSWQFYRLDAGAKETKGLLPKGMSPLPLPGFLIYEKGWAHSRRQGMPIPRKKDELDVDYQTRLETWLKDALSQKSFSYKK